MNKFKIVVACLVAIGINVLIVTYDSTVEGDNASSVDKSQSLDSKVERELSNAAKKNLRQQVQNKQQKTLADFDLNELPKEFLTIVGIVDVPKKADYNARMKAIKSLTRNLEPDQVEFLRTFLKEKFDKNSGMTPRGFNGVKNDVLDILLRQNELVPGIGYDLVEMFREGASDEDSEIWRDYCVQYFAPYYEQAAAEFEKGDTSFEPELKVIREAYSEALNDTATSVAGTALIGLDSLNIDEKQIQESAKSIVADDSIPDYNRITALRMAEKHHEAFQNDESFHDTVIELAQVGDTTPLRMAAIATLADIGKAEDIAILEGLKEATEDKNIIKIIDNTIVKLEGK